MDIRKFFLGRDEFKSPSEIIELLSTSKDFNAQEEDITAAEALLLFQTSKQQTWLVATRARLYCVLDDLNKSFTRVQWTMPAEKLVLSEDVTAEISTHDKSEKTGLLSIGDRHNWLFSKKLFPAEDLPDKVRTLIARQTGSSKAAP